MNEEIKAASVDSPEFRTEAEFAAYLDSLHETMPDGAVTNRKWEPAQRALAGLAASRAVLPVTDSHVIRCMAQQSFDERFARDSHIGWKPSDYWYAAYERGYRANVATPVAGWVSVEDAAPVQGVGVLVTDGTAVASARWFATGWATHDLDGSEVRYLPFGLVTHWKQLDAPPAPAATPTKQQEQS